MKRFLVDHVKLDDSVDIPLELDMSPWCIDSDVRGPAPVDLPPVPTVPVNSPEDGSGDVDGKSGDEDDDDDVVEVTSAVYQLQVRHGCVWV